jgi:hypothetical protein
MMICAVEEPLQPNEYLHMLDEQTGIFELSLITDERLNRYTFASREKKGPADQAFQRVLMAIGHQLQETATWLATWTSQWDAVDLTARSRWIASGRRREGWSVHQDSGLWVAAKPIEGFQESDFSPTSFEALHEGIILIYGNIPDLAVFTGPPASASMKELGIRKRMDPSRPFLSWLAEQKLSLAYRVKDERGYVFIVVITPHQLDLPEMVKAGVVDELRVGKEAGSIWS